MTITFKKQSPYPITETQIYGPLSHVQDIGNSRRYLTNVDLVEQELRTITQSRRAREHASFASVRGKHSQYLLSGQSKDAHKLAPNEPVSRESAASGSRLVHKRDKSNRPTHWHRAWRLEDSVEPVDLSAGQRIRSMSLPSNQRIADGTDCAVDGVTFAVPGCSQATGDNFPPLRIPSRDGVAKLDLRRIQFYTPPPVSSTRSNASSTDMPLPCLCSSLRLSDLEASPAVELGTTLEAEPDRSAPIPVPDTEHVDSDPAELGQLLLISTPRLCTLETDLHPSDINALRGPQQQEESSVPLQAGSSVAFEIPHLKLDQNTAQDSKSGKEPLSVQFFSLPQFSPANRRSTDITVMPGQTPGIWKQLVSVDCGTMTTTRTGHMDSSAADIIISTIGSDIVSAVTDARNITVSQVQQPSLVPSQFNSATAIFRQGMGSTRQSVKDREVRKANYIPDPKTLAISSKIRTPRDNTSGGNILNPPAEIEPQAKTAKSLNTTPRTESLKTDRQQRAYLNCGTRKKTVAKLTTSVIKKPETDSTPACTDTPSPREALALTLVAAPDLGPKDDIAIYRCTNDGIALKEDSEGAEEKMPDKRGAADRSSESEDIEERDYFLNNLNNLRRKFGLNDAYSNFGTFLANISILIRDHSASFSAESPSTFQNSALNQGSLSSTMPVPLSETPHDNNEGIRGPKEGQVNSLQERPSIDLPLAIDSAHVEATLPSSISLLSSIPEGVATQDAHTDAQEATPCVPVKQKMLNKQASCSRQSMEQPLVPLASSTASTTELPQLTEQCSTVARGKSSHQPQRTPKVPIPILNLSHKEDLTLPTTAKSVKASPSSFSMVSSKVSDRGRNTTQVSDVSKEAPPPSSHSPHIRTDWFKFNAAAADTQQTPAIIKPFESTLPGFEKGSRNELILATAFQTLQMLGDSSRAASLALPGVGKSKSKPAAHRGATLTVPPTTPLDFALSALPAKRPGSVSLSISKHVVTKNAATGYDSTKLILSRSALDNLIDMSHSDLELLRTNASSLASPGSVKYSKHN